MQYVNLRFSLTQRAFVQLGYAYFPSLQVILDGQPVAATETALGLVGFWAEPGVHQVELVPRRTSLARACTFVSGALWALALTALLVEARARPFA
jgi:hypothetical protein